MIKTSYDPETDTLMVWFAPEGAARAARQAVAPGITLDFDADGRAISIEVREVNHRMARLKATDLSA